MGPTTGGPGSRLLKSKSPKGAKGLRLTSITIRREHGRHSDSRSETRYPLRERTRVSFRSRERDAALINLSDGGAMIESGLAPNIGEPVLLHLDQSNVLRCVVRWIGGRRIGLEFVARGKSSCVCGQGAEPARRPANQRVGEKHAVVEASAQEAKASRSTPLEFVSQSGDPIRGAHRWTARLRNASPAAPLPQPPGLLLLLGSEVIIDLGSSGMITATISWTIGQSLGGFLGSRPARAGIPRLARPPRKP